MTTIININKIKGRTTAGTSFFRTVGTPFFFAQLSRPFFRINRRDCFLNKDKTSELQTL